MRAAYPMTSDGKKVHAVRGRLFEMRGIGTSDQRTVGRSLCDRSVVLRDDTQFDPASASSCKRCATTARSMNGHAA